MAFSRKRTSGDLSPVLIAKWPGRTLDEGFVPLPKRLLRCMGRLFQGPHAVDDFRVVMAIVDFIRPDLYRWPSYAYLGFLAGMTEMKVRQRIEDMQNRGWLTADYKAAQEQVILDISGLAEQIEKLTADEDKVDFDE